MAGEMEEVKISMASAMMQQRTEFCESTRERIPNPVLESLLHPHCVKGRLLKTGRGDHVHLERHCMYVQETIISWFYFLYWKQDKSKMAKVHWWLSIPL